MAGNCNDRDTGGGGTTSDRDDADRREGIRPIDVRSIVEEYDDRPDECTLYSGSVSGREEWVSSWISAQRGSFVDREEVR